jgi:hypothetical protein
MGIPKETALELIGNVPLRGLVTHIPGSAMEDFEKLAASLSND